jgi:type I restriction enzyme M protein
LGCTKTRSKKITRTKTSVLFLQKWAGDAGKSLDEYPVFMATSQRSGKDNSGQYIFRTDERGNRIDEDGNPITESGKSPAIDHDLDPIAHAFVQWGKQQGFSFLQD